MNKQTPPRNSNRRALIWEQIVRCLPELEGKTPTMVLSSDLTVADCTPQIGYAALVDDVFYIIEHERERARYPISAMTEFHATSGIGEVALECLCDGRLTVLCRGDLSHQNEYATIAKRINHYIDTGLFDPEYDKSYNRYCPKCGRKYRAGSNICMHCVDKGRIFSRLWEIARPYKWHLLLSIILFFAITGMNMIGPYLNRLLVDEFITPMASNRFSEFALVILSMFVLRLLTKLVSWGRSMSLIHAGNRIIVRLREMVFDKVQMLSISKISKRTAGEIMQRVTGDTAEIQQFIVHRLANIVEQLLILVGISIMLFIEDWRLALMIILPIPMLNFHAHVLAVYTPYLP